MNERKVYWKNWMQGVKFRPGFCEVCTHYIEKDGRKGCFRTSNSNIDIIAQFRWETFYPCKNFHHRDTGEPFLEFLNRKLQLLKESQHIIQELRQKLLEAWTFIKKFEQLKARSS